MARRTAGSEGAGTAAGLNCRAREVMRTTVITLEEGAPIEVAIRTLEEEEIHGAPVVDEADNVVGVLSLSDIARSEHVRGGRIEPERGEYYLADPLEERGDEEADEFETKGDYSPELLGHATAGTWMTPNVISVSPDASIQDVCRTMTSNGIHRVLVLENRQLLGIISTADVVRYLAEQG